MKTAGPNAPPCPCECNRGGFCGGCGPAGCGGRAEASRPAEPRPGFYRDGKPHVTAQELRDYAEMMKRVRK